MNAAGAKAQRLSEEELLEEYAESKEMDEDIRTHVPTSSVILLSALL